MKIACVLIAMAASASAADVDSFIAESAKKHGADGEKAAKFLVEHMPAKDRQSLTNEFLSQNLDLALQSRTQFRWAKYVPEDIFFNDVLPYAVFDESRDPWRADYMEKAGQIVKDAKSATEAAQALNREFFKLVNVHYNTERKAPNQSPKESMESGHATCTGLSIILVDACRAVGIPARAVGTPMWANNRGNHTWVEIWDGGWHFTGADEYDAKGLDLGWFVKDAAQADEFDPIHAIYATSWKSDGLFFPLVWAQKSRDVAAVNVTSRYAKALPSNDGKALLGVRLFDKPKGKRMVANLRATSTSVPYSLHELTKAGATDLNDMPRLPLKPGSTGILSFTVGNETREIAFGPLNEGESTVDAAWADLKPCSSVISAIQAWLNTPAADRKADAPALKAALSKQEAESALALLGADQLAQLALLRKDEMEKKVITRGDKSMRWLEKTFGQEPAQGRSLWISMHGGGAAPEQVNDQQWQNQIRLYQPKEGFYIAPRAPTNTWNLWHEGHIDPMFEQLIADYVALRGVNPNKIYLMGYSAGGDGVWQLAPRMADHFAAAAMMAGHPNESSLLGLRNLPFAMFVGGNDTGVHRNEAVPERMKAMDELQKADPDGYVHMSRVYEGLPHWMNLKDAEALPWMEKFERNPWPKKVIWFQDDITHDRFYWLKLPATAELKAGLTITASVDGQTIKIDGNVPSGMSLRLSDKLLDLDQEVKVIVNGKPAVSAKVIRNAAAIRQCFDERLDIPAAASAILTLP